MSTDATPTSSATAPGSYGQPPWAHVRPTNTKAILALCLAIVVPPAGIAFGVLARQEIRRTQEGGWGLATWGLGIGIAYLALIVLYLGFILVMLAVGVGTAATAPY